MWRRLTSKTELLRTLLSSRVSSARLAIESISSRSAVSGPSVEVEVVAGREERDDLAVQRLEGLAA